MRLQRALAFGGIVALSLAAARLDASGIPVCRVRFTTSGATPSVSRQIVHEVASWVDVPDRGCILVGSIAEADVVLELNDYTFKFTPDGMPIQEWFFVARRLGEPNPGRATHRFSFFAPGPVADATHRMSKQMPVVLTDVCLGVLPATPAGEMSRR